MGGPAVARGRGRPRKELARVEQPPQVQPEPSSPCNNLESTTMEDDLTNPNSHNLELGISHSAMEGHPKRLSWASIVQGTQQANHRRTKKAQVVHSGQQQPQFEDRSMSLDATKDVLQQLRSSSPMMQKCNLDTINMEQLNSDHNKQGHQPEGCRMHSNLNQKNKKHPRKEWVTKGTKQPTKQTENQDARGVRTCIETEENTGKVKIPNRDIQEKDHMRTEQQSHSQGSPRHKNIQVPPSPNPFAVLSDIITENQAAGVSQTQKLPIKALGAYPIDEHE
ncbi:unnamed protein product [Amaranthus hypochondriacus]